MKKETKFFIKCTFIGMVFYGLISILFDIFILKTPLFPGSIIGRIIGAIVVVIWIVFIFSMKKEQLKST